MLEQQLKELWKDTSTKAQINFDLARLMIDLQYKTDRIEGNIRARDRREIVASLIGIVIFSYFAYEIPFPITKVACLLAVLIFIFIIYKLRRARKEMVAVNMASSFREQLQQQKIFFKNQQQLLQSVLWWYLLPPFVMNIIFIVGIGDPVAYDWSPALLDLLPITPREKVGTLVTVSIFYGFVYWLNRRAAKNVYPPVIQELERVQGQLDD
ncbi:hypothetical protein [Lewinella cohaerens]|uniref:hypothetical protein n=1 Tax=Lewinella cohaerens TaxID=70995 RepID=UPI00037C1A95|nr:hypothetical protein [Lewinella cohaerens]